ncbi:DUF1203 domain-containing protein [Parasphingorhabdus sp.]|uniref:DUF1203 domain-containing protein n=1 Tax=Parasphingorhabdus sp. TaxID=2709688 RepID=UPI0032EB3A36
MVYQITGISPDQLENITNAPGTVRVTASNKPGFPCRVSLEDAEPGEELLLFNYLSHDVESPYRNSYAIYARIEAKAAARYTDAIPPIFVGRPSGMRAFGKDAMLKTARLSMPGDADATIRQLFELDEVAYIDVHNAAHGCFAARVERFLS